jgi:hypothetical protein
MNTEERAQEAQRLLDSPVFTEALQEIKDNYLEASLALPLHEKYHEERALNLIALKVVDAVNSHLRTAIVHGKEAADRERENNLTPKRIPKSW